ncbi:UNVERIFIED_CONTAM: hypothetical protein FKN15_030796 [Acipenser sinensis]
MSGVAEERVARQEPQQTGEADIWAEKFGVLTATTPALTREGEDERTLSSEASEDNAALGQLTGKPAVSQPDYRGRWCAVSRGHPDRPNPPSPQRRSAN